MPAGFLHQRAMDGLASGGFFLARATPGDLRGSALKQLGQRIIELGLNATTDILNSPDDRVQSLLRAAFGQHLEWLDPHEPSLPHNLICCAETEAAADAFPRLHEILFDSDSEFRQMAERFLTDEPLCRSIADEMHQIVVDRFSYRAAMNRFLHAMRDFLIERSSNGNPSLDVNGRARLLPSRPPINVALRP